MQDQDLLGGLILKSARGRPCELRLGGYPLRNFFLIKEREKERKREREKERKRGKKERKRERKKERKKKSHANQESITQMGQIRNSVVNYELSCIFWCDYFPWPKIKDET